MFDLSNLGNVEQFLPFVLIFVAFYFLLIRPQQKRAQDLKRMIESVRRGDTVVTAGGVLGKVTKVMEDSTVQVEIAENVRVRVVKSTIAEVRAKGEAVREGAGKAEAPANDGKSADTAHTDAGKKGGLFSVFKK
ncbi:MAG TPA: preprotein translocase subunit YajC [Candidatus Sulfotelmatobacter sp.]|nr:preprotein translocase subunit YajC [Candidatus Sulfotelmatobacter sp.]